MASVQSPETLGLDSHKVAALLSRVERDVVDGTLPNAQVALARGGRLAAFATFGTAKQLGHEVPATNDTLFCVFSCTKALTAVLAWQLIEQGALRIDERAADIVPEFGTHGKEAVTVEQLLTHTAGFPRAPFHPAEFRDRERRLARFSRWTLNWAPGSRFEYHPSSSMYVVAEILERRTGRSYAELIAERIARPLELQDVWVGLPPEHHGRVADVEHVGSEPTDAEYATIGRPRPPVTEVTEDALSAFNRAEFRQAGIPGGGGIMRAAELSLLLQALLEDSRGPMLCMPQTVRMGCQVRTAELVDPWTGQLANRGLGVQVAGDDRRTFRGFGKTNSALAFGHSGAGGQIAWVDPATGISLAYCTSGHDRNPLRRGRRVASIGSLAASCLRD